MTGAATTILLDGLACYMTGEGEPLFLMPYPHGFGRLFKQTLADFLA